jgi:hypothetical protein
MAIKKKDGSVYILEGPNPLVKTQTPWEVEKLVFHNFEWQETVFSFKKKKVPNTEEKYKAEEKPAVAPVPAPPPIPKETPPPEPSPEDERNFDLPYIKYKVLSYCLPAKVKTHTDSLYGESWSKTSYGKKFVFPCVVINSTDFNFQFWTSDPSSQITEKSVIYPFSYEVHNEETDSYDKVPYDEYRWWRITARQEKEGGWLFDTTPSDFQPDFSD